MERQVKEIVEFFTIKSVRDGELQGRVSGDLAWRLLRGETKVQEDEYKVREVWEIHQQLDQFIYSVDNVNLSFYAPLKVEKLTFWALALSIRCKEE